MKHTASIEKHLGISQTTLYTVNSGTEIKLKLLYIMTNVKVVHRLILVSNIRHRLCQSGLFCLLSQIAGQTLRKRRRLLRSLGDCEVIPSYCRPCFA